MNLLNASIKVGKVTESAVTPEQKESAIRFRELFYQHVRRENEKMNPIGELVTLITISFFAVVGVIATLAAVSAGLLD